MDPDGNGVYGSAAARNGVLVFAVAAGPAPYPDEPMDQMWNNGRYNLTLHRSRDGGRTFDAQRRLQPGYSGYVSIDWVTDELLAVLWETSPTPSTCTGACALSFTVINTTEFFSS